MYHPILAQGATELAEADLEIREGVDPTPILDDKTRSQYREALQKIEAEQATLSKQTPRYKQLQHDKEMILQDLQSNIGLGGKSRRFTENADRARSKVQKQISEAIGKIEKANPILGKHLRESIHTGHSVIYQPETSTNWDVKMRL